MKTLKILLWGLFRLVFFAMLVPLSLYIAVLIILLPNMQSNMYPILNNTWWVICPQYFILIMIVCFMVVCFFKLIYKMGLKIVG